MTIDAGGSMGYNDGIYGFGGGASLTRNSSSTTKTLIDMNGDGLPDLVIKDDGKLQVAFNKGTCFAGFVDWPGGLDKDLSENVNISLGGGLYFSIPIPIPYTSCSIIINPGFNVGSSMGREESAIRDIDGDGYPDFLSSDKDDSITVAENLAGRTNLLKSVKRPLGATMEFEYTRSGNTYDQPQSRWVLSKTTVFDGFPGDGVDNLVTAYAYEGGKYDRLEREFYGYRTVTEESRDAGNNEAVYRRTVQTYRTDSYYTKGLPERERRISGVKSLILTNWVS
jgi:hypothetical protein